MKQGIKPTRYQRVSIEKAGLTAGDWLIIRTLTKTKEIELVNKNTGEIKTITYKGETK